MALKSSDMQCDNFVSEVFCSGIRTTSSAGTDFFRSSNFRGPCYQEALLFLGLAPSFLLHCLFIVSSANSDFRGVPISS